MCLVHFKEFFPDFVKIFFRDRVSCIGNMQLYDTVWLFFRIYTDLIRFFKMMQRITQIVADNLLNFKFIRPDINAFRDIYLNMCI